MYKIITISRELGSGGRTIGKAVAEKLGYKFYDKEIVKAVAEKSGLSKDFVEENGEYANSRNSLLFNLSFSSNKTGGMLSLFDEIYIAQCNIIKELAEKEPCVIVGRCADYILRERTDCINIFIHSDMAFREKRIVEQYGEMDKSPSKRLKEKDEKRKVYYKNYTGQNWGMLDNYHIAMNSGFIGIEKCVDIIVNLTTDK